MAPVDLQTYISSPEARSQALAAYSAARAAGKGQGARALAKALEGPAALYDPRVSNRGTPRGHSKGAALFPTLTIRRPVGDPRAPGGVKGMYGHLVYGPAVDRRGEPLSGHARCTPIFSDAPALSLIHI